MLSAYVTHIQLSRLPFHELKGSETPPFRDQVLSRQKTIDVCGLPVGVLVHAERIGSATCRVSHTKHCQKEHNGESGGREVEYEIKRGSGSNERTYEKRSRTPCSSIRAVQVYVM
jgi:hypothetical protein